MNIKNQKDYFNETYESWKEINTEKDRIINNTIKLLGISKWNSLLDVASGTGVLFPALRQIGLSKYVALDISENMLKELKGKYTEAETICDDFDKYIDLEGKFDYIVIFNSIPHFENLNIIFSNACRHLNSGGKFAIVHCRTRNGLKEHHKRIGYNLDRDAIPDNYTLFELVEKYEFKDCIIKDEDFFYFTCTK